MIAVRVSSNSRRWTLLIHTTVALGSWADEMDSLPIGRKSFTPQFRVSAQLAHHAASGNPEDSRSRLSDAPDRGSRELRCQCLCIRSTSYILTSHGPCSSRSTAEGRSPITHKSTVYGLHWKLGFRCHRVRDGYFLQRIRGQARIAIRTTKGMFTQVFSRQSR